MVDTSVYAVIESGFLVVLMVTSSGLELDVLGIVFGVLDLVLMVEVSCLTAAVLDCALFQLLTYLAIDSFLLGHLVLWTSLATARLSGYGLMMTD